MAINALFLVETAYSSTKTAIDKDLCDNPSGKFVKLIVIWDCFQLFCNICTMIMISFCGCRNASVMQLHNSCHVEILVSLLLKFKILYNMYKIGSLCIMRQNRYNMPKIYNLPTARPGKLGMKILKWWCPCQNSKIE